MKNDFHKVALHSILFKGRSDWYFSYLKSEKIAHVLIILLEKSDSPADNDFKELVLLASALPSVVVHAAAREVEVESLLANFFSILSSLRLLGTKGLIGKETVLILIQEYENLATKIAAQTHPSPFVSPEDFSVPENLYVRQEATLLSSEFSSLSGGALSVKDSIKGQSIKKDIRPQSQEIVPGDRASLILEIVRKNNGVSIKDITFVVRNCSAKTVQRELGNLIHKGLVRREGERRWSLYFATPQA